MAHLTKEDATQLHTILDRSIGVFRDDDMPAKFLKFYEGKKQEFIETFNNEIPSSFWFHGGDFRSVNLNYSSDNGFHIESLIDVEGHLKPVIDQTNRKLREATFEISE